MKVYPLHIGDTKVPYGQFYGGLGGWDGIQGFWRFATDKNHYIIVPIYAYLIDHPHAGLILVDTGINWEQAHAHNHYYKGPLLHLILDEDEYLLTREQALSAQVQRLGYRCEDIHTVILTHLHEDHVGELRSVSQAKVVLPRDEWDARTTKIFGIVPLAYPPSIASVTAPELVSYSSGPFHSFERSQDLLGDGSIILLPTPGHSPGHQSVLLQMEGYQILLVGDNLYTLRHLAVDQVRAITIGGGQTEAQVSSIRRTQQLRRALPEMVIVPTHDHTAYQFQYLEPFLADGVLSPEERQAIKTYEARMFDEVGHLVPSALPHFLTPLDKGRVGTITEP